MKSHAWRISTFALLIVCSACSGKKDEAATNDASSEPEQSSLIASNGGKSNVEAGDIGKLVDLIAAEAGDLPRADFDPAALAAKLGKEPQAHFNWVRDHTWWAPYRGLLRGSRGVLIDRIGSNLDRAVLLGDLLRRSGHVVRLAHADLPEARARELLGKIPAMPAQRTTTDAALPMPAERKASVEKLVPGFDASLQEQSAKSAQAMNEAQALVRTQGDELYAMLRDTAAKASGGGDGAAIAAMRDYWWVERQEGGKWIAMDVLLPDAQPGRSPVAATSTSPWGPKDTFPTIPESDWHSVQVAVVVERYENGTTGESTALETALRPAVVFDRPMSLVHVPDPWPDALPDPKTDPNAIGNAAVNVRTWIPVLRVGDELISQSGLTEGGGIEENPFNPQKDISETGGSGLMGGMDAALAGGETPNSYMTAEWIDYEIRVPGEPARKIRRPVFDLLGPVKRAAQEQGFDASTNELMVKRYEALLSRMDILLQPCQFTEAFVTDLMSASVIAERSAIRGLGEEGDRAKLRSASREVMGRIPEWGPLPDLVLWRSSIAVQPGDSYIDRPNVLSYRITRPIVSADQAPVQELIDLASNGAGVRPGTATGRFEVRLRQGVADTVAEMMVLGSDLQSTENTASLFAMSGPTADHGAYIAPRAKTAQDLGWQADDVARLAASVDAGYAAVALKTPVSLDDRQHVGWWQIDPRTGETVGVMDNGWHAAMTEKEITDLKASLRAFLQEDAGYWRHMRGQIQRGHIFSQQTYNQLWQREAVMQVLRDLAALGL